MLGKKIKFEGVKGVGTVDLDLQEDQRVYTLIGTNGVGKTKTLEALFQVLFFTNSNVSKKRYRELATKKWVFESGKCGSFVMRLIGGLPAGDGLVIGDDFPPAAQRNGNAYLFVGAELDSHSSDLSASSYQHNLPVIFLASQSRGFIEHNQASQEIKSASIGSFDNRRNTYFKNVHAGIQSGFSSLNMNTNVEQWFVTLAQSSNRFQKGADNREVEISSVLKLLNILDSRIDPEYLEIDGDGRVSLKIENQPRELSHLSTGFASILKIIQAIVSGYGCFTNENSLEQVKGIVLIDEIESHLHLTWQAKIIPLLKQLFPNTTFYVTTHSSVVLSQLHEVEAYLLERSEDVVVRSKLLKHPNKAAIVDVLKDAFDIDLNKIKRNNMSAENQKVAKQQLLDLLTDASAAK